MRGDLSPDKGCPWDGQPKAAAASQTWALASAAPRSPPAVRCPFAWGLPGRSAAQSPSLQQRTQKNGPRVFIPPQRCSGAPSSKSRFCKRAGVAWLVPRQCASSVCRDQRDKAPLLHQGLSRTPGAFQVPEEVSTSRQVAVPTRSWCQAVLALPSAELRWQPLFLSHPSPRATAASCVDGSASTTPSPR